MKIKGYFAKAAAAGFALLLVYFAGAPVCYAYPFPEITNIATLNQLLQWYNLPDGGLAQLTHDIEINRLIELKPSSVKKGINTFDWSTQSSYTIRVLPGATLIVDNPKIELSGEREVITVEGGGTLLLRRGRLDAGIDESAIAIAVKKDGKATCETDFILNGSIKDENTSEPPEPVEPPIDTRIPITSLFDDKAHISCVVGEQPDKSLYLETVYAYFGESDGAELPVKWGLSAVNFTKPGTYTVIGTLTEAGMQERNLSNPKGYTAKMTITVYQKGAPDSARGEVLSVGSAGNAIARLILPALPTAEISAVYIYQSTDQRVWKKAARDLFPVDGIIPTDENFLPAVTTVGSSSYIPFYYQTDYKPLWVRVETVGSDRAGMSNAVQLILPEGSKPGDNTQNDSDEDAGDSGGNRGGVGQEETERVLPPEDGAKKQAAIPVAAGQSGTGGSKSGTAVTGETADKPADSPFAATPVPGDQPVMAEPQPPATDAGTPAKPAIPGAAAAAVCTTGAVAAVSVLLKFNWKAIVKFIQRKP